MINKLKEYYVKAQLSGYIPSTIGVSDEEYDEYLKDLKDLAENHGLVFTDTPIKLMYKGIELKKYGKKHTDSKLK